MKLCKLVFVLGPPEVIHRVYSRQKNFFCILKGQLGIAAFIFLLICARTVSLEGYILNADLRFYLGVYATSESNRIVEPGLL